MKLLEQFGIILTLTFIVETIKELIPLPIPASIYGLILMLTLLKLKIIPIISVKHASKFCWKRCLSCSFRQPSVS